jgi:hypothetical protein
MDDDEWVERFRLREIPQPKPNRKVRRPSRQRPKRFLNWMPFEWFAVATRLGWKPLVVAMCIRHEMALRRATTFPLPNKWLSKLDVDRKAKRRSLAVLEKHGLITVKQRKSASPIITVIDVPDSESEE